MYDQITNVYFLRMTLNEVSQGILARILANGDSTTTKHTVLTEPSSLQWKSVRGRKNFLSEPKLVMFSLSPVLVPGIVVK